MRISDWSSYVCSSVLSATIRFLSAVRKLRRPSGNDFAEGTYPVETGSISLSDMCPDTCLTSPPRRQSKLACATVSSPLNRSEERRVGEEVVRLGSIGRSRHH